MSSSADTSPSLQRLIDGDAVGQLRRRSGRMAELGSADGQVQLDWVDGVQRLLDQPELLHMVENEAREILVRGIRHVIWAGMGGSVMAVRVLTESEHGEGEVNIIPLDSTDPAALDGIIRELASRKGLSLLGRRDLSDRHLRVLLADVLMVGVSMGMTSEEPITHLEWFGGLIDEIGLERPDHMLAVTLPDSYLDAFARKHGIAVFPPQLDGGTGTPGRMSAPTTRTWLLPAALVSGASRDSLHAMLSAAWARYDLDAAETHGASHPAVLLASRLSDAAESGVCRLMPELPPPAEHLLSWIEQLMEESLGKGGKGVLVFPPQRLAATGMLFRASGSVRIEPAPLLAPDMRVPDLMGRIAVFSAAFLGWQLCTALYGYLHDITFCGQPAVEMYKSRARALRNESDPLSVLDTVPHVTGDGLRVAVPAEADVAASDPVSACAGMLARSAEDRLLYIDFTLNGEFGGSAGVISRALRRLANEHLGIPFKLRRAPAAYHASEQSEMDGPADVMSLRAVRSHPAPAGVGSYDGRFLLAQAVSTWQSMIEVGRPCALIAVDEPDRLIGLVDALAKWNFRDAGDKGHA